MLSPDSRTLVFGNKKGESQRQPTPAQEVTGVSGGGAYHCHIQFGIIAQGLLHYLALTFTDQVWSSFGSWIQTIRPGLCPSEAVTVMAMRNSLPTFLSDSAEATDLADFLRERIDQERAEGLRLLELAA